MRHEEAILATLKQPKCGLLPRWCSLFHCRPFLCGGRLATGRVLDWSAAGVCSPDVSCDGGLYGYGVQRSEGVGTYCHRPAETCSIVPPTITHASGVQLALLPKKHHNICGVFCDIMKVLVNSLMV